MKQVQHRIEDSQQRLHAHPDMGPSSVSTSQHHLSNAQKWGVVSAQETTLGNHLTGQYRRICRTVGLHSETSVSIAVRELLGTAAHRALAAGPAWPSFISDDHTPLEFSLTFPDQGEPSLRILIEPGSAEPSLYERGVAGLESVQRVAGRWGFSTHTIGILQDLFLPDSPRGPFAIWCALELQRTGLPNMKVYFSPEAHGSDGSAAVVEEAFARLGLLTAFSSLPKVLRSGLSRGDKLMFFAIDIGRWPVPRVKLYFVHHHATADHIQHIASLAPGTASDKVRRFCIDAGDATQFCRRPLGSSFSFTSGEPSLPRGYTVHVPVRDYAVDDAVVYGRAANILGKHGMPSSTLRNALAALTSRRLEDGVGLISYLSRVEQGGRQRITAYLSSEAYQVRPPSPEMASAMK